MAVVCWIISRTTCRYVRERWLYLLCAVVVWRGRAGEPGCWCWPDVLQYLCTPVAGRSSRVLPVVVGRPCRSVRTTTRRAAVPPPPPPHCYRCMHAGATEVTTLNPVTYMSGKSDCLQRMKSIRKKLICTSYIIYLFQTVYFFSCARGQRHTPPLSVAVAPAL